MQQLTEYLNSLKFGASQTLKSIEVFPIIGNGDSVTPFLELEEAIEKGLAEVAEVSEGGSVSFLNVVNKSDIDLIIFDGEQLIGAKQNRIANLTVIVPGRSKVEIPVSCVEQGRWNYRSSRFSAGNEFAYPSLRRTKHSDITDSLRGRARHESDQSRIWRDISEKASRMDVESPTLAMADMFSSATFESSDANSRCVVQPDQIGYLAFIGGGFAGGDMFSSTSICERKLNKLLLGYSLDALDRGISWPKFVTSHIFEEIKQARFETFDSVGSGIEYRFESSRMQGSLTQAGSSIVHMAVFPKG